MFHILIVSIILLSFSLVSFFSHNTVEQPLTLLTPSTHFPAEQKKTSPDDESGEEPKQASFTRDEPFAWASREFLRKQLLDKKVELHVEHQQNERLYCTAVWNGYDLAETVVSEGWAKPRVPSRGVPSTVLKILMLYDEEARAEQLGCYAPTNGKDAVRVAGAPLKLAGGAAEYTGVVEQVRSGSSLRVCIMKPGFHFINVQLAGVASPQLRRGGEDDEPFAREAKAFTERRTLTREVRLRLVSQSKHGDFKAVVRVHGKDLGEELCGAGLASTVPWDDVKDAVLRGKLESAEASAKRQKLRIWSSPSSVPALARATEEQARLAAKAREQQREDAKGFAREVSGVVVEVQTPGVVVVECEDGKQHVVSLSSVKVPRYDRSEGVKPAAQLLDNTLFFRAREALRKACVGKPCTCVLDYARAPFRKEQPGGEREREREREGERPRAEELKGYYTVYVAGSNVSVPLVAQGLVEVVAHRATDPRSRDYDALVSAEDEAKRRGVGRYASRPDYVTVKDITANQSAQKSRQIFSFMQHAGKRFAGVVDYCFSTTRCKLYVPQHGVYIPFVVKGVRAPKRDADAETANAGLAFARRTIGQRDVSVTIASLDKGGNFFGELTVGGADFAELLAAGGYVRADGEDERYQRAEEGARAARRGLWAHVADAEPAAATDVPVTLQITYIVSPMEFSFQEETPETLSLGELHAALDEYVATAGPYLNAKKGALVAALDGSDNAWYRARVGEVNAAAGKARVFFIDYGYASTVALSDLRLLTREFTALPPQALTGRLAYVVTPSYEEDEEEADAAGELFSQLTDGQTIHATVVGAAGGLTQLWMPDVAHRLVAAGLAHVPARHAARVGSDILAAQRQAMEKRLHIWKYGDKYGDDDAESD